MLVNCARISGFKNPLHSGSWHCRNQCHLDTSCRGGGVIQQPLALKVSGERKLSLGAPCSSGGKCAAAILLRFLNTPATSAKALWPFSFEAKKKRKGVTMNNYSLWADLLNKFHTSSEWIQILWLLTIPALLFGLVFTLFWCVRGGSGGFCPARAGRPEGQADVQRASHGR